MEILSNQFKNLSGKKIGQATLNGVCSMVPGNSEISLKVLIWNLYEMYHINYNLRELRSYLCDSALSMKLWFQKAE